MFCVFVSLVDFRIIDPTKPLVHYFGATSIINDPSIGEVKVGDLTGVLVYNFKTNKNLTLLSYSYDSTEINLLSFGSHENFYRDLKKYKRA